MKQLFLICTGLLAILSSNAQKNFEGRIDFLMVSKDSNVQVQIQSWFGRQKIKFITHVIKAPKEVDIKDETIILDFDNAVIDRFKDKDKKVERESMTGKGKKQDIPALKKDGSTRQILNYACTGYGTGKITKEELKDSVMEKAELEVNFWYADELYFEVPDSLKMIQMVPLFTNGHIALGSTIEVGVKVFKLRLNTIAKSIIPAKRRLPRSLFRHPRGYRLIHNH